MVRRKCLLPNKHRIKFESLKEDVLSPGRNVISLGGMLISPGQERAMPYEFVWREVLNSGGSTISRLASGRFQYL